MGAEFRIGNPISLANAASVIGVGNSLSQMRNQTYQQGGNCVASDSWFPDGLRARQLGIGNQIVALDYQSMAGTRLVAIQTFSLANEPCVRITSASGATLVASTTTPVTFLDHTMALITDCVGELLPVQDEHGFRWEPITNLIHVGMREVVHIFAGQATFAAGERANRFIFTHNLKQ